MDWIKGERGRERERERERETETETERERDRERQRERQRETERDRQTDRDRETEKETKTKTERKVICHVYWADAVGMHAYRIINVFFDLVVDITLWSCELSPVLGSQVDNVVEIVPHVVFLFAMVLEGNTLILKL